jgi:hypothetical protein
MDRETSDPACARRVLVMDVAGARGRIPQLSEIARTGTRTATAPRMEGGRGRRPVGKQKAIRVLEVIRVLSRTR